MVPKKIPIFSKKNIFLIQKLEGASFSEFLQHVVDHNTNSIPKNEHWETYWSLCYPCDIKDRSITRNKNYKFFDRISTFLLENYYIFFCKISKNC